LGGGEGGLAIALGHDLMEVAVEGGGVIVEGEDVVAGIGGLGEEIVEGALEEVVVWGGVWARLLEAIEGGEEGDVDCAIVAFYIEGEVGLEVSEVGGF
jgi:hypothetical protein